MDEEALQQRKREAEENVGHVPGGLCYISPPAFRMSSAGFDVLPLSRMSCYCISSE